MFKKILLSAASLLLTCTLFAQTQNVTFQVSSPDSTPVFVFGSWSGWTNWPGNPMTLVAPGKWSATLPIASSTIHEYLFVNGGAPYAKETLDPTWPCTNGNSLYTNRVLALGTADTSLCYTWNTCTTCPIAPPPTNVNVTFQVENPDSTPVYVFGSWSGWSNWPGDPMTDANGDGIYDVTLSMLASSTYEYLYVNGVGPTKETLNPAWLCTNGNGTYTNRVLNLGATNTTLCNKWASCDTCGAISIPPINVTFKVENTDSSPVYVFGSWSGWSNWPGTLMTYNTTTMQYEAVISIPGSDTIEYLFVNGVGPTKELLDPTWPCTNADPVYTNRKAILGAADTSLCTKWETCDACGPTSINEIAEGTISLTITNNSVRIISETINTFDQLEIYDVLGRRVFNQTSQINANREIPVQLQNTTMYIFRLRSGNDYYTVKGLIK